MGGKDSKRKLLTAQMREKHAQEKAMVAPIVGQVTSESTRKVAPTSSTEEKELSKSAERIARPESKPAPASTLSSVSVQPHIKPDMAKSQESFSAVKAKFASSKTITATSKRESLRSDTVTEPSSVSTSSDDIAAPAFPTAAAAAAAPSSKDFRSPPPKGDALMKKQLLSPRSPMETYEISDREGSDSESESESEDDASKQGKKVSVYDGRPHVCLQHFSSCCSNYIPPLMCFLHNRFPNGPSGIILFQHLRNNSHLMKPDVTPTKSFQKSKLVIFKLSSIANDLGTPEEPVPVTGPRTR